MTTGELEVIVAVLLLLGSVIVGYVIGREW